MSTTGNQAFRAIIPQGHNYIGFSGLTMGDMGNDLNLVIIELTSGTAGIGNRLDFLLAISLWVASSDTQTGEGYAFRVITRTVTLVGERMPRPGQPAR